MKSIREIIQSLHHIPSLKETIARMLAEGRITEEKRDYIEFHLREWVSDSKYILFNLGVHIGIGFLRFTVLAFPLLGSTLRVLWVMANRIYCTLRWDMHRKRIHSLPVLFFSIIPFLGYLAYTIPLKKKSEYLAYLYAQHISYMLFDETLDDKLEKKPRAIREAAYALLLPKEIQHR